MKTNTTIAAIALTSVIALATGTHAATKTLEWGNSLMGAKATGTMTYYTPPTGGFCAFTNTGRVDGSIFFKSINLASGAANFRVNSGSKNSTATGYVKVGTKTLASWNKTIIGSDGFSTDPLLGIEKGGSFDVIPYVLSIGATASVTVRAEGLVYCSPSTANISATFGVSADVAVVTGASFNAFVLAGGLVGKLDLCHASLLATAKMSPSVNPLKPNSSNINYSTVLKTRSPGGSFNAWYKWRTGTKKEWTILSYTPAANSTTLASGSFVLNGSPILR